MATRPLSRCPGCKRLHDDSGKCADCRAETQRASDQARGTPAERGYGTHWVKISANFVRRNPMCCLCGEPAKVSDHYPESRRQLVARGVTNPDAARYLRPLCRVCHSKETAVHQPGGWNRR